MRRARLQMGALWISSKKRSVASEADTKRVGSFSETHGDLEKQESFIKNLRLYMEIACH